MGNLRAQFLLESVLDLKAGLRGVGSDLVVHLGKPEDAIPGANSLGEPLLSFLSCEHQLAADCTTWFKYARADGYSHMSSRTKTRSCVHGES